MNRTPNVILRTQKYIPPRAREDEQVKQKGWLMIDRIYAKCSGWSGRVSFWQWHQRFSPELTRTTMLEF